MTPNQYQKSAGRTLIDKPDRTIPDNEIMIVWNAIGLAGEAGEVAELAKKGVFHQHGIDKDKFADELGDCMWYIAAMCTTSGLDLEQIMADNISKLEKRYPNGYSLEASRERVDVGDCAACDSCDVTYYKSGMTYVEEENEWYCGSCY